MSQKSWATGIATPVIRKLIRRGDVYLCSICRSEYDNSGEANTCLNHCWFDLKNIYPVLLRRGRMRATVYRCHFCCRDHREEAEALLCARRCMGERNQQHLQEQLLNDLPLEAPPKRPSRLRLQLAPVPVKRKAPAAAIESDPELSAVPASPEAVSSSPPATGPEVDATPPPVEMPDREIELNTRHGRHKDTFAKPWVRHDAKYKCNCCLQMYFTKMEAESCFAGHFDEQGYEKETDGAGA